MILMLKTISIPYNVLSFINSQLLSQGEYSLLFTICTQILIYHLLIIMGQPTNIDWCFINGLNAKQKILLNLLTHTIITILYIYIIFNMEL